MEQIYKQMVGFQRKVFIWGQILYLSMGLFFAVLTSIYHLRNITLFDFFIIWMFVAVLGEIQIVITRLFSKKFKEVKRFQNNELKSAAQVVADLSFVVDTLKGSYKYMRNVTYNPIFGVYKGDYREKESAFYYAEDRQNKRISPIGRLITIFQIKNSRNCPIFSVSNSETVETKGLLIAGEILGNDTFHVEQTGKIVMRYNPKELTRLKSLVDLDKVKQFVEKYPDAIVGTFADYIMLQKKGFIASKNEIKENLDFILDI